MGRHVDLERPSEVVTDSMHETWETTQDIEVLREALRWQGMVTHVQDDRLTPMVKAIANVRNLYLLWEQEFTGVGVLHDVVQDHVSNLRQAIEDELGDDW